MLAIRIKSQLDIDTESGQIKTSEIKPLLKGTGTYYVEYPGVLGVGAWSAKITIEVAEPKVHVYSSSNNSSNIKEDVNNDGLVTSYDIMEANKHKGETVDSSNSKYDLNGDNQINDTDIAIIEQVTSNITNKAVHKNLIFPGDKINLKIFEETYSGWPGKDVDMSNLEYTAKLGKANGDLNSFKNFNDLKIKINGTTGILEIDEDANFDNNDILALSFKIKQTDSWITQNLDLIENWVKKVINATFNTDLTVNKDGEVYNANEESRSLRDEVATIYFYVGGIKSNSTWKYKINANNTVDIVKYLGTATEIAIPNQIDGISVSKISAGAFSSTDVTKITLGANITTIDEGAFTNATKLQKIEVNTNNPKYWAGAAGSADEGVLYEYVGDKLLIGIIKYPEAKTGDNYTIRLNAGNETANHAKYIAKEAFYNTKLIKIGMPDNISKINEGAFKNSKNLTTIENTDNTIKALTDTQLETARKSKQLSNSLTYIGKEAFYGCSSLETIRIPNTNAQNTIFGKVINKNNANDLKNLKVFTNVKNVEYYKDDNSMEYYVRKSTENYIANIAAGRETNFILVGKNIGTIEYWESTKSNMICVNKGLTYNLELERDKTYSYMGFMQFGDVQTIDLVNIGSQYKVDTNHSSTNYADYIEITKLGDNKRGIKIKAGLPNDGIRIRMAYEAYEGAKLSDTYYFDLYITESTDTWRGVRLAKSENGKLKVIGDGSAIYRWEAVNTSYNYDTYNNTSINLKNDALTLAAQAGRKEIINDSLQFVLVDSNGTIQSDVTWTVSSGDARYVFDSQKNQGFSTEIPGLLNLAPFTKEITTDMLRSEGKDRKITLTITATKDGKTTTFDELYIMPRTIKSNENTYYILDDEYGDKDNWHKYVELIRMEPKTGETTLTVPVKIIDDSVNPASQTKDWFVVRNIATRAIRPNSSITKVNIQNTTDENLRKSIGIKDLNWGAIAENNSVKEILLSEDVIELSANFATLCTGLEKYTVDSANTTYMSKDGVIYSDKNNNVWYTLYAYPQAKLGTTFTVPETVTTIGWYAFNKNTTLTTLSLPDGLKNLKRYSLVNMYNVTNIFIPSNVETIGDLGSRNINKNTEADIAAYLKTYYNVAESNANVIGHVFDRDDGKKYNVYFDASNKISKDYAYYFGDYKLSGAERPTYINDITGGKPEANFKTATVASANLYNKQPISKNYYVGENVNNDIKDLQLEVTYMDENKTLLDKVIVNVPSDRIIYQKPEWAFFTKFYEPTTNPITLYVNYEGVRSSPIVNANVTIGPLEVDSSKLTTKRFLANSNLEYVKEMLVVNKVNSDGTKTKLENNQYTLELVENKIIVKHKDNTANASEQNDGVAPRTFTITGITIYNDNQVEKFTNIPEADYKVLKEKLANNIIHYDDTTRTIVIPNEDIEKGIEGLKIRLTKVMNKRHYVKGVDTNVDLAGMTGDVIYTYKENNVDKEIVLGSTSNFTFDKTIDELLTEQTEGKNANITKQTTVSVYPKFHGKEYNVYYHIFVDPAEVESIYIAQGFDKMEYKDGEEFDKTGLVLMAKYRGNIADAQITNRGSYSISINGHTLEWDGSIKLTVGQGSETSTYDGVVTYKGKTAEFEGIVVSKNVVEQITATRTGVKNEYYEMEEIAEDAIKVEATYTDGTKTVLDSDQYYTEPKKLALDTKEVTVVYAKNKNIKTTVTGFTIKETVVESVQVSTAPKKYYEIGDTILDVSTGILQINYENNEPAPIKVSFEEAIQLGKLNIDAAKESLQTLQKGTHTLTGTYTEKGKTFTINWNVEITDKINSISVKDVKTNYLKGTALDLTGGKLVLNYEDTTIPPKEIDIKSAGVTIGEPKEEGNKVKYTISYEGKTAELVTTIFELTTVEALSIVNTPTQTEFYKGVSADNIKLNGGKVAVKYVVNSAATTDKEKYDTDIIDMTDSRIVVDKSKVNTAELGTYPIALSVKDVNKDNVKAEFNVNIAERLVQSIKVEGPQNKNFVEGNMPINSGLKITVEYLDVPGNVDKVTFTDIEKIKENFITEPEKLSVGDTEFTVKYKYNTQKSQTITGITVVAKAVTNVELQPWENMPEQNVANVNWEGAKIKVTYNDGTQETLAIKDNLNNKDLVIENFDQNKQGVYNVAISYKGVKSQNTWEINLIEKVKEIKIDNYPKTEYLQDSDIDLSAGTIRVVYEREEAKPEIISMTDSRVVVEGIDGKATETKELTVKYNGMEAKFWITVIAKEDIEFTNLEIVNEPHKTEYKVGQELDLKGGKVKLTYKDKETSNIKTDVIDMLNSDILTVDSSAITDNNVVGTYAVKVKLKDNESLQDEFTVDYLDKVVQSLIVINEGMQQEYLAGEKLNKNGLKVALKYDNGTSSVISDLAKINETFIIHPEELSQEDDGKTITVTYRKNQNISATIDALKLKIIPITSITITEEPRAKYIQGEGLDLSIGAIKVEYSNEQEAVNKKLSEISDKVIGFNGNKVGKQTVAVNYGGAQTTFEVEVIGKEYVTDVSIEAMPKTKYNVGNELDLSDGKLKVQYITGSKLEDIVIPMGSGAATVKQADLQSEGNKVVILDCAGHEVTFEITVEDKEIGAIEIKTEPSDKKYLEGETFNPEGMVVVAKTKGGKELKTLEPTEYSYSQEPLVKGLAQEIEVKYNENELITTKITGIDVYTKEEIKEITITKEEYDKVKDQLKDSIVTKEDLEGEKVKVLLVPADISIQVETPENDAKYLVGNELEVSRYKVIVKYGSENPIELTKVALENSMITEDGKPYVFAENTSGQEVEITAKYLGAEAKFKVQVADSIVVSIAIEGQPTKINYLENEAFSFDGIKVVGKNKDGMTVKTLTTDEFTIEPTTLLKGLDRTITITSKENSSWTAQIRGINVYGQDEVKELTIPMADYNAIKDSVADKIITKEELANGNVRLVLVPGKVSIEVRAVYDKEYNVGDSLDLSNYKVIVNYGEGDSKLKLTEITLAESMLKTETTFTKEQAGTAVEIAIDYLGAQTSFKVNVSKEQGTGSISLGSLKTQTIGNETYLRIENGAMTVKELKQIITNANKELDLTIEVLDNKGNVMADTEIFTTGMTIKISSSTEAKEFILAKVGYTNSDNKLTISDLMKLLIHLAEENADSPNTEKLLTGAYLVAADVTGDGKVNMFDIIPLVNLINNN